MARDVIRVKKTNNDGLQLMLRKGGETTRLKEAIGVAVAGAEISTRGSGQVFHLRGLGDDATENEIKNAVEEMFGAVGITVRAIRPGLNDTRNATQIVPVKAAEKLTGQNQELPSGLANVQNATPGGRGQLPQVLGQGPQGPAMHRDRPQGQMFSMRRKRPHSGQLQKRSKMSQLWTTGTPYTAKLQSSGDADADAP